MLWNDTRSHAEASAFDADPQFRKIAGNIVFPGFTAPKVDGETGLVRCAFERLRTLG